jgi:thiol-disulfide isomerase/thioredoxin
LSNAIQVGPLLLPFTLLLVFASAGSTLLLGKWLSKAASADVEQVLWHALLVGALLARLAFVYQYRTQYLDAPMTILDIRDGGWNATFGLVGAWAYVLYRGRSAHAIRKPLRWALGVGTAVFVSGTAMLSFASPSGQKLPELALTSLEGQYVRLNSFEGKPTVVNLWATWCPPCVREMPLLQEAQAKHRDVSFVFLNQGEDEERISVWLSKQGLPLRNVLLDPQRLASNAFQQNGYPTTLFFNSDGVLVSVRTGELSKATLSDRLKDLMQRP